MTDAERIAEIDCPLCGETVRLIASATMSLALWQHVNWSCGKQAEDKALLATRTQERDEAIKEHGKESGFWGRAAAREVQKRKAAEAENTALRQEGDAQRAHNRELLNRIASIEVSRDAALRHMMQVQTVLDGGAESTDLTWNLVERVTALRQQVETLQQERDEARAEVERLNDRIMALAERIAAAKGDQ